jgi:hypothetical protein
LAQGKAPPEKRGDQSVRPVLYIHGATFPSAPSIAHRFDGWSWRDARLPLGSWFNELVYPTMRI